MHREMLPLFGSPVFISDLTFPDLVPFVLDLQKTVKSTSQSNAGGWQSPMYTNCSSVEVEPLWEAITQEANRCHQEIGLLNELKIKHLWFNVNEKHHFNWPHTHVGSIHSGSVYLQVPENSGDLRFQNSNQPAVGWAWSDVLPENTSNVNVSINQNDLCILPRKNMFVMFPSWLNHSVFPNTSDEKRISVAFDMGLRC